MKKIGLSLIIWLTCLSGFAQKIDARLDVSTVSLGEKFQFTIEIECHPSDKIRYSPENKFLKVMRANENGKSPDQLKFELVSKFSDTTERIQGKFYWRGTYNLICFDTGYLILPPGKISINNTDFEIQPALLRVNLTPAKKGLEMYDIEEHFAEIPEVNEGIITKIKTWTTENPFLAMFILMSIVTLAYFTLRRKSSIKEIETLSNQRTHLEVARQELDELMQKQLWLDNQMKEHFVSLSNIVRDFLNRKYDNRFIGKTSFEIQLLLRKENFSEPLLYDLGLILNVSDMVKFAQSSVEEEGIQEIYRKAAALFTQIDAK